MNNTERLMRLATQAHQSNQLTEAEQLYQLILQQDAHHPEANHNLAVLAVQTGKYADSLPYFVAALDADPSHGPTWLNYIEALYLADHKDDARQILELAKQQGLTGRAVDELTLRLSGNQTPAPSPAAPIPPPVALPASPSESKPRRGKQPDNAEVEELIALFNAGQIDTVIERASTLTRHYPGHSFGWKALGAALQRLGQHKEALPALQKTVLLSPGDAEAHNNLGIALQNLGQLTKAASSYQKALKLQPDRAQTHCNLGSVLENLGHTADAEICFRRAITLRPDYAKAHNDLGVVLYDQKNFAESETAYRQAIKLIPDYADAYKNLGRVLIALKHPHEAESVLRHALELNPTDPESNTHLAELLHQSGKLEEAFLYLEKASNLKPNNAEALLSLGVVLNALGRLPEAESRLNAALHVQPQNLEALELLGLIQYKLNHYTESEITYRRLLILQPEHTHGLNGLANALKERGQFNAALSCYQKALEVDPTYETAHLNIANVYLETGLVREAEGSWRKTLEINPNNYPAHSNLLFCLSMADNLDAQALFEEHRRFGKQAETKILYSHNQKNNPTRCLQIGFLSADWRDHVIANFFEPLLEQLANSQQLRLHGYYNYPKEDAITQRIKANFAHWHAVAHLSDDALVEQIRNDGIDILIDLSGHTAHNRLPALAQKPAPIQVSWMGYPGTTGMHTVDYYFSDRFILPAGKFDALFTEKIVRLPANAPFLPSPFSPPVNTLPALSNGYITLGSFNRIGKLNPTVVAVWAKIMDNLPDSQMVVGGLHGAAQYDLVAEWFAAAGISRERLQFHPRSGMAHYLGLHHLVDFCLDTFPYGGGTTTLHAAWMGVPTLTVLGDTIASRTGNAVLGHLGLNEFIANSPEEFIQKGLQLASDLAALSDIRNGLRERFTRSAIGQPELIAAGVERALRAIWQRWCAELPPVSFDA